MGTLSKGHHSLESRPRRYISTIVFLVSYEPDGIPEDVRFSYYKDTRTLPGGKLKLGYGPGGPPVLKADKVEKRVEKLSEPGPIRGSEASAKIPVYEVVLPDF